MSMEGLPNNFSVCHLGLAQSREVARVHGRLSSPSGHGEKKHPNRSFLLRLMWATTAPESQTVSGMTL